jgi:prolyl oligopeptidase
MYPSFARTAVASAVVWGGISLTVLADSPSAAPATPPPAAVRKPAEGPEVTAAVVTVDDDPHLWLEDVLGENALSWVRERNGKTLEQFAAEDRFRNLEASLLTILDDDQRIPAVTKHGGHLYNFWRDKSHPRGLWRRTTLDEYRRAEPAWEILLDLDALGKDEGENWVWAGATVLRPDCTRALLSLSRGGADARVVREFDIATRRFVEDGFTVPEAKSSVSWIDRDAIFVASDFGPGSMTESGYPRTARLWRRGTPLTEATTVFEGDSTDMSVSAFHDDSPGHERNYVRRARSFYADELFVRDDDGRLRKIEVPDSASKGIFRGMLAIELREPWEHDGKTHPAGSLLLADLVAFLANDADPDGGGGTLGGAAGRPVAIAFTPDEHTALAGTTFTRNALALTVLADVKNRVEVIDLSGVETVPANERVVLLRDRIGSRKTLVAGPDIGTVGVQAVDADESDDVFLTTTGFLEPTTLSLGSLAHVAREAELLKQLPQFFDTAGVVVRQHFATSADGTRVPYFLIGPAERIEPQASSRGIPPTAATDRKGWPTVLYAYGGFEISLLPRYNPIVGRAWLEQGGVYVVANIRGGGEYGPRWHQAALKANRPRAYEDCAAVARDLIERGITSAEDLAVMGGSNGGLLVGNMITREPDLFAAAVCQVPLLDMKRYRHLLAGASWMDEYGDPDKPEEWAFVRSFSPYHTLAALPPKGSAYPATLFLTSTRDDRVHPGHARKMMAQMEALGHAAFYYENIEGGHGGAATNEQQAFMQALAWTFLREQLGLADRP